MEKFPIVTITNHAGEVTITDFTPTAEDQLIGRFFDGKTNIPPTIGTISRSGIRLTIGGDPEDTQPESRPEPKAIVFTRNINDIVNDEIEKELQAERDTKRPRTKPDGDSTKLRPIVFLAADTSR